MRIAHHLLLASASSLTAASGRDSSFRSANVLDHAEDGRSAGAELAARYPLPEPQCDSWVGLEVILITEITEICPEGSTVTSTITECVKTLTRSICATPTTNLPCYPCVMGTPAPSETATVTWTSCSADTDGTITVTFQPCSACDGTTYVGTVPGYTPGGPCVGCSPFTSASSSACSEESGSAAGPLTTVTTTSTSTSTVTRSGCGGCGSTSSVLGNSGLSSSATATHPIPTSTTHTTFTSSTTAAPPVVTAGGVRNGVGFAALIVVWVVVGALLGM